MAYLHLQQPLPLHPPASLCYYVLRQPIHIHRRPPLCPSSVLSSSSPSFQPNRVMVRWTPPRAGYFKLNFDGSVYRDGSGRASIGGAICGPDGRVVLAFAETTEHSTVGVVEARALIRGLRLALACSVQRLVVEGDDLVLVQLLRGEKTQTRIPAAMRDEILGLLGRFAGSEVQHIYREGNQVAHVLCRQAYVYPGVWAGGLVSPAVKEKVDEDRRGVAHERLRKQQASQLA
ncbi:hypothetical protein GUJ93_ZPchr0013g34316 [Zizania palustris]|uniref:RNase H type-1 domain-containing protein n=1 Tax=Zizania palustris TaxID=103762 RepID=A0A8J5WRL3_ZIZPA|nr:hypothetical protein GUJ93_ZPchr0013g34105 [Zizania palustris]KAG8096350.1 hypothetical protein GUJ93_ZPchr0013g34316 [Zizania palustris]